MCLYAFVLGSFSIQAFVAYLWFFGSIALLGILVGAGYAGMTERPMRPWLLGFAGTLGAIVVLSVIGWMVTDAVWKP